MAFEGRVTLRELVAEMLEAAVRVKVIDKVLERGAGDGAEEAHGSAVGKDDSKGSRRTGKSKPKNLPTINGVGGSAAAEGDGGDKIGGGLRAAEFGAKPAETPKAVAVPGVLETPITFPESKRTKGVAPEVLMGLSNSEVLHYQRTGQLPKKKER